MSYPNAPGHDAGLGRNFPSHQGIQPSPDPQVPANIEIDKVERASSIATSAEPTGVNDQSPFRRLSLSRTGHISLDDVEPVDVHIRGLSVTVDTAPSWLEPSTYPELARQKFQPRPQSKKLLRDVNASLPPGTLTAIIGGSGSGKTTLLNTMSERTISSRLSQEGLITFNGNPGIHSVRHAYVMQQDILLSALTVRETLQYSANLRLPPSTTQQERAQIVEEVILELGLKECANTRIGNHQHRGCSGGERRRVSIGVQLLANPSVLFLDEPTTGLDATSAFQLVRTLKSLASKGRTIITTIHQPRSEIWDLFDNLIILARGCPVYSGRASECVAWFGALGFQLPPFVNPAEHLIDIAAVDNRTPELEAESTARVGRLHDAWYEESTKCFLPPEKIADPSCRQPASSDATRHATYTRQLRMLTDRTFKVTHRDPLGMLAAILEAILMGLVTGYIFFDLPRDDSGIRSRQGALYTASGLQGYLILIFEIYRLSIDMPTFDRERTENCVDAIPFLLSRRLARLPTEDFPVPFLFSVIFYFMAGFDRDANQFFIFFAITLLNHYIAMTCAMACVTAVRHFPGASLLANLIYTMQSMACGMFVQSESIPVYVRWLKYITYTYYVFSAYCGNEFERAFYNCPLPGGRSNPACNQYTGEFIMKSLGFPDNWVWRPILVMVAFVVFFCIVSWIGLQFIPVKMTIARARNSDTDLSAGKEKLRAKANSEVRTIDVGLDHFTLDLHKRSPLAKKSPVTRILNPVTTTFHAGVLNIIMGPSGSGKTSLLNSMALRLHNTMGTQYKPSGKLTFNGAVPSASVIRSVCSYVCQDDDALLPSLTVRETLRFSAGLRLPSWMSREEKYSRAEDVLLKMGLKDCADNLVGSDLIKGISGGEKRRVSIAVQLLSDPRVLLLDEPTSGLDAFTANSIMEVLRGLAMEGRTLILTIHQARSDLYKHFGNVLLLARGGIPAYAGPAGEMMTYLNRLGFDCPSHTNPADFALDLVMVDLQQADREAASRVRVKRLVDAWEAHVQAAIARQESGASGIVHESRLTPVKEADEGTPGMTLTPTIDKRQHHTKQPIVSDGGSLGGATDPAKRVCPQHGRVTTETCQSPNRTIVATPAELGALVRKRAPFTSAAPLLIQRALINFRRQPPLLLARTMQVVGLGVVLTLFFAPLENDLISVQNRMGFVQQVGSFYFVGMLQNVAVYPAERDVFYREDDDGVYSVEAFLASYTLLEIPFEIISCLIFGVLAVLAVGFPRTAEMYFVSVFCCFAIVSCGESVGIMFNTLFSHTGFAVNLTSIFLSLAQTMAGILSIDMPGFLQALNHLSPIRYAARALAPFSLRDVTFSCTESQKLPTGECPIQTGQDVLDLYQLNANASVNIAALAGCAVAYRVVAWVLLRLIRSRIKISK
ncbi:ABC transporter [Sodiomyces alkalinus F11]|uniref:ABC transporter n=1 Tax=Sodiomyces alkalinus (strain CBS 110278 / VKM F-3762 / F11) TaxID=1314773 RepID=A0A3N2PV19_SODAK|nr:ABC transporter [Sodiomyces alkalinus F11]ROT38353.1 ABC transporter [Sodiomyces alkalinus F11]